MWLGRYVERVTGGDARVGRRVPRPRRDPPARHRARCRAPNAGAPIRPSVMETAAGDVDSDGVHMLSTSGLRHAHEHPDGEFIVATETGMLYPMQEAAPEAEPRANRGGGVQVHEDDHAAQAPRLAAGLQARDQGPAPVAERARCRSSAWSRSVAPVRTRTSAVKHRAPIAVAGTLLRSGLPRRGASFSSAPRGAR